jgi:hypothetical protein
MQNGNEIGSDWLKNVLFPLLTDLNFSPGSQANTHEFFLDLLDFIEAQIPGATQSFQSKVLNTIKSIDGKYFDEGEDNFSAIPLPAEGTSLEQMIEAFFKSKLMDEYELADGSFVEMEISKTITNVPEIVAFQSTTKLHPVAIPFEFDLGPHCLNKQKVLLELVAVNVHIGSNAHYVSLIRNENNRQWILFNDLKSSPIAISMSKKEISRGYFRVNECLSDSSATPYIWIYRHKKECPCRTCKK